MNFPLGKNADMAIRELSACFLSFLKNPGLIICSEIID
jgi:hypothetical protein